MKTENLAVENWIAQDELPVRAGLKVIHINDPDFGLSDDEIQDRNEFIRCYLLKEYNIIMLLPEQKGGDDFFYHDFTTENQGYSAYNTHDFQDTLPLFNRYAYAMRKIMERAQDLAILYSVINSIEDKKDVYQKFERLLENAFNGRLMALVAKCDQSDDFEVKSSLKSKIAEVNRRIQECKMVWERFAPRDT